jgi:hypothetical protein
MNRAFYPQYVQFFPKKSDGVCIATTDLKSQDLTDLAMNRH